MYRLAAAASWPRLSPLGDFAASYAAQYGRAMRLPARLLACALLGGCFVTETAAAAAPPSIREHHVRAYGIDGTGTKALISALVRVCSARGTVTIVIRERVEGGGMATAGTHFRFATQLHQRRCAWHEVDWTAPFGTHHLKLLARDRYKRGSRAVFVKLDATECHIRRVPCVTTPPHPPCPRYATSRSRWLANRTLWCSPRPTHGDPPMISDRLGRPPSGSLRR